jgi:signal peptidase I
MKAKRIVFRILIIVLIGVVLGSAVYTWNAKRVLRDEFPMPLGFGVSVVLTGSMEPKLHANDMVFIVKTAQEDYKVGDIAIYQSGSSLVIHRIVSIDEVENNGETVAMVTLKGDANNTEDEPVKLSSLKGRMKFSIPFVGLLIRGIKSPIGVILILALAFFLMHRSWQNEKRADNDELDKIKDEIRQLKDEVETGGNTVEDIKAEIERLKQEMAASAKSLAETAAPQAATELTDTTEDAADAADSDDGQE